MRGLDAKTIGLQYPDALKSLGSSPATKLVLPLELVSVLRTMIELATQAVQADVVPAKAVP